MKYLRIVALGWMITVQTSDNGRDWKQTPMCVDEFETLMKEHFPKEYSEYQNHLATAEWWQRSDIGFFFYHYGETEEMKRHGDAYIFEKGVTK